MKTSLLEIDSTFSSRVDQAFGSLDNFESISSRTRLILESSWLKPWFALLDTL